VNAILNAIGQYTVDNKGDLSGLDIDTSADEIGDGTGDADICDELVPKYIPALPTDPDSASDGKSVDCSGTYSTGYEVAKDTNGRITVSAPLTVDEDDGTIASSADRISVTR
jgi:hypothetical protein